MIIESDGSLRLTARHGRIWRVGTVKRWGTSGQMAIDGWGIDFSDAQWGHYTADELERVQEWYLSNRKESE